MAISINEKSVTINGAQYRAEHVVPSFSTADKVNIMHNATLLSLTNGFVLYSDIIYEATGEAFADVAALKTFFKENFKSANGGDFDGTVSAENVETDAARQFISEEEKAVIPTLAAQIPILNEAIETAEGYIANAPTKEDVKEEFLNQAELNKYLLSSTEFYNSPGGVRLTKAAMAVEDSELPVMSGALFRAVQRISNLETIIAALDGSTLVIPAAPVVTFNDTENTAYADESVLPHSELDVFVGGASPVPYLSLTTLIGGLQKIDVGNVNREPGYLVFRYRTAENRGPSPSVSSPSFTAVLSLYEPELQAVIDTATTASYAIPGEAKLTEINEDLKVLKAQGAFQIMDYFYALHCGVGYEGFMSIDFKRLNVRGTFHGGYDFSTLGFKPNGTTGYFNPIYNPAVDGINYTLNNAGMYVVVSEQYTSGDVLMGMIENGTNRMHAAATSAQRINNGTNNINSTDMLGTGLRGLKRDSAVEITMLRSSSSSIKTSASTAISNGTQVVGRTQSAYGNSRFKYAFQGGSIPTDAIPALRNQFTI